MVHVMESKISSGCKRSPGGDIAISSTCIDSPVLLIVFCLSAMCGAPAGARETMLFVFAGFFIWFTGDFPSAVVSARTATAQYFYQAEKVNEWLH